MALTVQVRRVLSDIQDALASSLDIREAVERSAPLLLGLIKADYAALAVSKPGIPADFEWIVARMPPQFFGAYPELARHDFVLRSVLGAPNRVLRDTEMLARRDLESNALYRAARDLGMPLEQVMSTMLHVDDEWSSGISVYRAKKEPFSEQHRAVLEAVTPALKHAVRNCRLFAASEIRRRVLDELIEREHLAVLVFSASEREIARSEKVTALIERWFCPVERGRGALPLPLVEQVRRWTRETGEHASPSSWERESGWARLVVRPYWIREYGERCLVLTLRESADGPLLPDAWKPKLTRREQEVAAKLLFGWDNRAIAEQLGCAEETVKKHVTSIFDKLGADRRSQLIERARREAP